MPDLRPILHINGWLLAGLAVLMLIPACADLITGDPDSLVFLASAVSTGFFGMALVLANRRRTLALDVKQAFVLTTTVWVSMGIFAALPFKFADVNLSYAGSFFEATSGLTTTGATVLVGLDHMPPGILLWRGLLELGGGLGIIVMAIAILPFLRVGGMQLLRTESSDRMDKVLPRARQLTLATASLYLFFAVLCGFGYWAGGMAPFDATVHAMTTISTGGFSTSDASLSKWPGDLILWNGIVFMFLGSLPFTLYLRTLKGSWRDLVFDDQVKLLVVILLATSIAMTIWMEVEGRAPLWGGFEHALFNILSVISGTGYMSQDYGMWGGLPHIFFAMLLLTGGCTGSTTGGIKMMRFAVLWQVARSYVRQLITPHGIFQQRFNGMPIGNDVAISVVAFVGLYLASLGFFTIVLAWIGLDPTTSFAAAAACLGNVGPGLGEIVGPSGTYRTLPQSAIWVLSAAMVLGRLELFTVLVMFTRHFWRS
ncbi:MAG: TrkH family potassium uptake protein [Rhodobacteraceae bacterium]|nr:TrkH family potassium uptake protein [Paracoccaceae bacterium]